MQGGAGMITEKRLIIFSSEALLQALALYASAFPAKMPEGKPSRVWLKNIEPPIIGIEVAAKTDTRESELQLSQAELAALLIHFCRREKIPLPRTAEKSLAADNGQACLVLTKAIGSSNADEKV